MAWIKTVDPDDAEGPLRVEYDEAIRRCGRVHNVIGLSSLDPPALSAWTVLYKTLMFGPSPLSRAEREMIATVVSVETRCHY